MTEPTKERRRTFTSTTGGVMTEEAGAITGELELLCRPENDLLHVLVRYAGAEEWYTVSGGPVGSQTEVDIAADRVIRHLTTPGPTVDGNETAATLEQFPAR